MTKPIKMGMEEQGKGVIVPSKPPEYFGRPLKHLDFSSSVPAERSFGCEIPDQDRKRIRS